jgi:hypothetical protein
MSIYTSKIKRAQQKIKKYGQQVDWTVTSDDQNAQPNVQHPFVVFKTSSAMNAFLRFIAGTSTTIGNVDAIMGVQSFTPTIYDSISRTAGGVTKTYSIKSLTPVQPGAEIIVWKIELNK